MSDKIFQTYEVGSLAKQNWRLKGFTGAKITDDDIAEAIFWGKKLDIDYSPLIKILKNNTTSLK
jgi:hypothetical protein